MEQQFTTLYLKHDFTKDEMGVMHKELAQQTQMLRHKENEKKAAVAQFGSEIEKLDTNIGSLADKLNAGFEHRQMKCIMNFDWDKDVKHAVHPETGEIVSTMDISADERQLKLKMVEEEKAKKKKN